MSKRKKKAGRGHAKGSSFEREICKLLSLWWTDQERDDIFWRTAGSGARAKTRSKTGQKTFGQYSDIQATDPIGQPLIDLCTLELKRGYNKASISDLLDNEGGNSLLEGFIEQAIIDHQNAGSRFWVLLLKRDRRETIVLMSNDFYLRLVGKSCSTLNTARPLMRMKIKRLGVLIAVPLTQFLHHVAPEDIKELI